MTRRTCRRGGDGAGHGAVTLGQAHRLSGPLGSHQLGVSVHLESFQNGGTCLEKRLGRPSSIFAPRETVLRVFVVRVGRVRDFCCEPAAGRELSVAPTRRSGHAGLWHLQAVLPSHRDACCHQHRGRWKPSTVPRH